MKNSFTQYWYASNVGLTTTFTGVLYYHYILQLGISSYNISVTLLLHSRALTPLVPPLSRNSAVRCKSDIVKQPMPTHGSFKDFCAKTWSSEEGAYPIIVILAFACCGSAFYGNYLLFGHSDVRMDPAKRGSVVRYWGKGAQA